jgi:hypothetical protein
VPLPLPHGIQFFYEVLLPGLVGAVLSLPLLPAAIKPSSGASGVVNFVGVVLLLGIVGRVLQYPAIDFITGRYWPKFLRQLGVAGILAAAQKAEMRASRDPLAALNGIYSQMALDNSILRGPKGERIVLLPTLLGNALVVWVVNLAMAVHKLKEISQLNLADTRFLMNTVVRAWISTPQDVRRELWELMAPATGFLRLAFLASVIALAYLLASFIDRNSDNYLLYAVGVGILARIVYRVSAMETIANLQTLKFYLESQFEGDQVE